MSHSHSHDHDGGSHHSHGHELIDTGGLDVPIPESSEVGDATRRLPELEAAINAAYARWEELGN